MVISRKGFSLVELLIVLVVIASLIAIVTPIALNSIRKAKSTSVANDLKTLSKGFMNYVYTVDDYPDDLNKFARNVDSDEYGITYDDNGNYVVYTNKEVNFNEIASLIDVTNSNSLSSEAGTVGLSEIPETGIFYYASLGLNPSDNGSIDSNVETIPTSLNSFINNNILPTTNFSNGYSSDGNYHNSGYWDSEFEMALQGDADDGQNVAELTNPNNTSGNNGTILYADDNLKYVKSYANTSYAPYAITLTKVVPQDGETLEEAFNRILNNSTYKSALNGTIILNCSDPENGPIESYKGQYNSDNEYLNLIKLSSNYSLPL